MRKLNEIIIQRISYYMNEQNLTQYRLAEKSGIPFSTIKSIMQHKTKDISLKTIILLAKGLGITPSEFLNDKSFLADNLDL